MEPGRARALAIALLAIASTGCAELAQSAPALRIEGAATERARASSTEDHRARWSWAIGVSLSGRYGEGMPRVVTERPHVPRVVRGRAPCRIEAACAWEATERASALARMRRIVEVSR